MHIVLSHFCILFYLTLSIVAMRKVLLLSLTEKNIYAESLRHLLKVTQLGRGGSKIWNLSNSAS